MPRLFLLPGCLGVILLLSGCGRLAQVAENLQATVQENLEKATEQAGRESSAPATDVSTAPSAAPPAGLGLGQVNHVGAEGLKRALAADDDMVVLVDFYADWCGPCRKLSPVLTSLAAEYRANLLVVKVDVDKNPDAARAYGVRSIPDLRFFKGGTQVDRQVGAPPKQQLVTMVERHGARTGPPALEVLPAASGGSQGVAGEGLPRQPAPSPIPGGDFQRPAREVEVAGVDWKPDADADAEDENAETADKKPSIQVRGKADKRLPPGMEKF